MCHRCKDKVVTIGIRTFNYYIECGLLVLSWICFLKWVETCGTDHNHEYAIAYLGAAIICRTAVLCMTVSNYLKGIYHEDRIIYYGNMLVDFLLLEMFRTTVRQALLLQEESNWYDIPIYIRLVVFYHLITSNCVWKFILTDLFIIGHKIWVAFHESDIIELQRQRASAVSPKLAALNHESVYEKFFFENVVITLRLILCALFLYLVFYVKLDIRFSFGSCPYKQNQKKRTHVSMHRKKGNKCNLPKIIINVSAKRPHKTRRRKVMQHLCSCLSTQSRIQKVWYPRTQIPLPNDLNSTSAAQNEHPEEATVSEVSLQHIPKADNNSPYQMSARPKGMCVIINNRDFSCPHLNRRDGTDEDVNKLSYYFKRWQFELKLFQNQTDSDMLEEMKRISSLDHQAYDCFVCFILSHGQQDSVYGSNGRTVCVAELQSFFSARQCRSLAKKPKLFFIQACQGGETAQGVDVDMDHDGCWECDVKPVYPVHEHADFLTVFSTVPGYIAYRNKTTGSPFICTLLDVLDISPGLSLIDIITKVTNRMDDGIDHKQIPMFKSTLRKQVILNE